MYRLPSDMNVEANFEEFWFVENLVEDIARQPVVQERQSFKDEYLPFVRTSSVQAPVCGNLIVSEGDEKIETPFTGYFLFTCCGRGSHMKIAWSSSLS